MLFTAIRGVHNTARSMAMKLCQEYGSMKLTETRNIFELGSDSGITESITRLTHRMRDDDKLKGVYDVLCQELTP